MSHNPTGNPIPCEHNKAPIWLQSLRNSCGGTCGANGTCSTTQMIGSGLTTAVIDDANEVTYIYGSIVHENYHVPEELCSPYFTVPTTVDTYRNRNYLQGHELFEGEYSGDNITLQHIPDAGWPVMVFRNGLKQREGQDYEYTLTDAVIHFNFSPLLATDYVEVYYRYIEEA